MAYNCGKNENVQFINVDFLSRRSIQAQPDDEDIQEGPS